MRTSKLLLTAAITAALAVINPATLAAESQPPPEARPPMSVAVTIDNGVDEPIDYTVVVPRGSYISEILAAMSFHQNGPYVKIGTNPIWQGKFHGQQILQIGEWRNTDIAEDPNHPSWARDNNWWTILTGPTQQRKRGRTIDLPAEKIRDIKYLLIGPTASATTTPIYETRVLKSHKYQCPTRIYLYLGDPYKKKKRQRR